MSWIIHFLFFLLPGIIELYGICGDGNIAESDAPLTRLCCMASGHNWYVFFAHPAEFFLSFGRAD